MLSMCFFCSLAQLLFEHQICKIYMTETIIVQMEA